MKKTIVLSFLGLILTNSVVAKVVTNAVVDHNDGIVTVFPIKAVSLKYSDACGYPRHQLVFNLKRSSNKNRICRKLGFSSYVPNSLVITNRANLFLETLIEETMTRCMGARNYYSKGIKSIDCYKNN